MSTASLDRTQSAESPNAPDFLGDTPADDPQIIITDLRAKLAAKEAIEARRREKCNAIRTLRFREDTIKSKLKECKGEIESAVDDLLEEDQPTLFHEPGANGKPIAEAKPADESWRETPLAELGLSETILGKLAEKDVTTMGTLADFSKDGVPVTQIPGIGPKTAETIEEATTAWWTKRKEQEDAKTPNADFAIVGVEAVDD